MPVEMPGEGVAVTVVCVGDTEDVTAPVVVVVYVTVVDLVVTGPDGLPAVDVPLSVVTGLVVVITVTGEGFSEHW